MNEASIYSEEPDHIENVPSKRFWYQLWDCIWSLLQSCLESFNDSRLAMVCAPSWATKPQTIRRYHLSRNNIVPMTGSDIVPENWWLGKWKFVLGWPIFRCYIHRSSSEHEKGKLSKAQSVKYNSSIHFFPQWEKLEWMLLTAMSFSTESMIIATKGIFIQEMSFQISIQKSQSVCWGDDPCPLILWHLCCRQGTDGSNKSLCSFRAPGDLCSWESPKKMENRSGRQTYTNK